MAIALGVLLAGACVLPAAATAQAVNPGWIADSKTGCKVANPKPIPSESISWSGRCVNGIADGPGVLQWFVEGKLYNRKEGEFRAGRLNGKGKSSFNGMTYEGTWRDGVYDGQGTFTWPNGNRYSGGFKDGEFSGRGVLTSSDGSRYEGDWKHSAREGHGINIYADSTLYEGEWRNDKPNGRGKAVVGSTRRVFEGNWVDGCFHQGDAIAAIGTTKEACERMR
jgi:hypothetical protein